MATLKLVPACFFVYFCSCPGELRSFANKCMAAKPEERPAFQQVLKLLDDLIDDLVRLA